MLISVIQMSLGYNAPNLKKWQLSDFWLSMVRVDITNWLGQKNQINVDFNFLNRLERLQGESKNYKCLRQTNSTKMI